MTGNQGAEHAHLPRWFTSWKPHAFFLVFFLVALIRPLRSSAPLLGVYFPGAFVAMNVWGIVTDLTKWSPTDRPLRSALPVPAYLIAATTTLFAAYALTGRSVYLHGALASLIMTIPFSGAGILTALFRHRLPATRDPRATAEDHDSSH